MDMVGGGAMARVVAFAVFMFGDAFFCGELHGYAC
jgi:hypothetical protein